MPDAVVLRAPRDLRVESVDAVALAPGQVRVATLHSGISAGTELSSYRGANPHLHKRWDPNLRLFTPRAEDASPYPVRDLGYEEVGRVVERAPDVSEVDLGDVVFGTWGHRSQHVMNAGDARDRRLPPGLDPLAGIFSHIGSTALNGVHDGGPRVGETVAVFGLGVLGQIVAQLVKRSGARVIGIDTLPARLRKAQELGAADVVIEVPNANAETAPADDIASHLRDLTDGRGADVAFEVSGTVTGLHQAIRSVAYAARVIAMGFYQGGAAALSLGEEFHHNRVTVVSSQISGVAPERSYRWSRLRLAQTVTRLQADGTLRLTPLVTHRFPLAAAPEAFALLDHDPAAALQVVLDVEEGQGTR
jgi:2-desacetyl-2-hydroxyethyl bacteriochlorophyllide A dehydrogenase